MEASGKEVLPDDAPEINIPRQKRKMVINDSDSESDEDEPEIRISGQKRRMVIKDSDSESDDNEKNNKRQKKNFIPNRNEGPNKHIKKIILDIKKPGYEEIINQIKGRSQKEALKVIKKTIKGEILDDTKAYQKLMRIIPYGYKHGLLKYEDTVNLKKEKTAINGRGGTKEQILEFLDAVYTGSAPDTLKELRHRFITEINPNTKKYYWKNQQRVLTYSTFVGHVNSLKKMGKYKKYEIFLNSCNRKER